MSRGKSAALRYGGSITSAVRCSRPSASISRIAGNRRASRAARVRFRAMSSDMRSSLTQYEYMDE
jgi:hypothetical protein